VVTAGRSVWVLAAATAGSKEEMAPVVWDGAESGTEHRVLDAVASDRSEFSVLAGRQAGVETFSLSGRLELGGDAALYGAPDVVAGLYEGWGVAGAEGGDFDLELIWDNDLTLELGILGATPEIDIPGKLQDELLIQLLKGE
jgi:hypothetical protein